MSARQSFRPRESPPLVPTGPSLSTIGAHWGLTWDLGPGGTEWWTTKAASRMSSRVWSSQKIFSARDANTLSRSSRWILFRCSVVWQLVSENSEEQISSNLRKKLPRSHKVLFNVEVKILLKKQKAGEGGGDVGASHGCTKPVIREVGKQPPLNTTLWLVSGNTILSEALTGTVLYHLEELTFCGYITYKRFSAAVLGIFQYLLNTGSALR